MISFKPTFGAVMREVTSMRRQVLRQRAVIVTERFSMVGRLLSDLKTESRESELYERIVSMTMTMLMTMIMMTMIMMMMFTTVHSNYNGNGDDDNDKDEEAKTKRQS